MPRPVTPAPPDPITRWSAPFAARHAAALLALALVPGALRGQDGPSLEELAEAATRAVVLIDVETPSGNRQASGFLVDPSGRILTNAHVVRGAVAARVKLASGDVYDAVSVLATDERRDLAVLQVAGFDLPALPLGNSDSVRIGHPVVLIGSPLGLENTVTTGIVSGRRQEPEGFQLLQVSAPASRGSSGGPLLSKGGEVVGIASSQMQTGQNLNFAVPINYARGMLAHLGSEPARVLGSRPEAEEQPALPLSSAGDVVNAALRFDLGGFEGYTLETEAHSGTDNHSRSRVTYRLIETVGGGEPRIERYLESETTRRAGPFDTEQTIRRQRARTLVRSTDLRPISTRGEVARWTGESWERAEYELEFEGDRVRGLIADSAGRTSEVDRTLPRGVIPREVADLAFATLSTDSLVGRSVEFITFDPFSGEISHDRYDVRDLSALSVAGEDRRALRVNVARGLSNTTVWFAAERPRVFLRRESRERDETEEVVRLEVHRR